MFRDRTYIRPENFEGDTDWLWTQGDTGAWDGPVKDWSDSHKHKYFKNVKKFDVVVTAGANHGLHTRHYAKMFKAVYAFEPDPMNFFCLTYNVQTENVYKFQAALGSHTGIVSFDDSNKTNTGMHQVKEGGAKRVQLMNLDSLLLKECDLLQLDVEGYEYDAIVGASSTISRCRPVVVLERGNTNQIIQYMEAHGYTMYDQSISDTIWVPTC